MRKRGGRLPRSKQLDAPLKLYAQQALCVDPDDALTRGQQAHCVLQPLSANRIHNLSDAHKRYTQSRSDSRRQRASSRTTSSESSASCCSRRIACSRVKQLAANSAAIDRTCASSLLAAWLSRLGVILRSPCSTPISELFSRAIMSNISCICAVAGSSDSLHGEKYSCVSCANSSALSERS
jgi:hypothetical protein